MKPDSQVLVREPQGYVETLRGLFEQEGFCASEPVRIENENLTPQSSSFYEWAKKDPLGAERSIYLPMEFVATLVLQ